jgi:hypothetical protein
MTSQNTERNVVMPAHDAKQAPNPWIARSHFDTLHARCAEAERCLKDLLNLIDPEVLDAHDGDWQRATAAILQGQ